MRFLIAGGGTGGHIYPALSIADEIKRLDPSAEFLFVGTGHGLEAELVPRAGYALKTIQLYGFQRHLSGRNIRNLFLLGKSLWDVKKILWEFRPDVAVGTGGYVCGPVLLAAAFTGIPTLIQEQNAFPGVTNRILGRIVDVVALGYEEAALKIRVRKARVVVTGNPVRVDLLSEDREAACRHFGFQAEIPTVLITGGSQGAQSINQAALTVHRRFAGNKDVQILHITGQTDYNKIISILTSEGLVGNEAGAGRMIVPYLHEMPKALAVSDLAVSRAGAIGLAELTILGIPAVLVPYPYASENHQEINARFLEKNGAAVVIRDTELTGDLLYNMLRSLIFDEMRLRSMSVAAIRMSHPGAASAIASLTVELAGRK